MGDLKFLENGLCRWQRDCAGPSIVGASLPIRFAEHRDSEAPFAWRGIGVTA